MASRNRFEEMLERLIDQDRKGAEEIFHEIVVEKSRDIYESLLEDDLSEEDDEDDEDEDLEELAVANRRTGSTKNLPSTDLDDEDEDLEELAVANRRTGSTKNLPSTDLDDEDDDLEEDFDLDEFAVTGDTMAAIGGDATDNMMGDVGMDMDMDDDEMDMDDDGMDMGDDDDEEIEDRVEDLEDALDELKAEFEKMMAGEEGEDEMDMDMDDSDMDDSGMDDSDMDDDDMDDDDMDDDEDDSDENNMPSFAKKESTKLSASEQMREYVEKVAPAKMGDNGVNTRSPVAGKNDMGGTSQNILRADTEQGVEANKGKLKGSSLNDQTAKEDNAGNVNVPGAKGATKMASQPGHGAEKRGRGETADKSATSTLNKVSSRAK